MQTLNIDHRLLVPSIAYGRKEQGVHSFIARGPHIEMMLESHYGRSGLCLKVFKADAAPLSEFCWREETGVLLTECTKAQNLFALHGFAPRVYDIVLLNGEQYAQVTSYVEDDGGTFDVDACREAVVKRYVLASKGGDPNAHNLIGSQKVDFQHNLTGPRYEKGLDARIHDVGAWGSRPESYQDVPGLTTESQRDTVHRVKKMRWAEMDFTGKTVLDLGCNLGAFCRLAYTRGAVRVVGVDKPHVAEVAYEVANYLEYWNLDFVGASLPQEAHKIGTDSGIDVFDCVLALSCKQTKPLPWAAKLCGEVLFLEGHGSEQEHTYRERLEAEFAEVEFLGSTTDHGVRPLLRCWKHSSTESNHPLTQSNW